LPLKASNKNFQSCGISRFLSLWQLSRAKPVKRQTVRARPARKNGRGCGAGISLLSSTQIARCFPPLLWFASFKPFPSKMGRHGGFPEILPVRGGQASRCLKFCK